MSKAQITEEQLPGLLELGKNYSGLGIYIGTTSLRYFVEPPEVSEVRYVFHYDGVNYPMLKAQQVCQKLQL